MHSRQAARERRCGRSSRGETRAGLLTAAPARARRRAGERRPATTSGGAWPRAELRLGAIRRRSRVAALRRARSRWRCRGEGTAGPRDSSDSYKLPWGSLSGGYLKFAAALPWLRGRYHPEYLGGAPWGPLIEDTRRYPVEGGEGCDRGARGG
ncbi:hypothetical protein NDU88_001277 [Pleurodeles waltl]|uniref:Uncharacterized protein n=1 Tax=Pleurodeles waltl TaxID=8319 RepID=A0AAV7KVV1_PLEWA|nr:hypothetical protein NDU88_001277 [Pleurodeles waltl]